MAGLSHFGPGEGECRLIFLRASGNKKGTGEDFFTLVIHPGGTCTHFFNL